MMNLPAGKAIESVSGGEAFPRPSRNSPLGATYQVVCVT